MTAPPVVLAHTARRRVSHAMLQERGVPSAAGESNGAMAIMGMIPMDLKTPLDFITDEIKIGEELLRPIKQVVHFHEASRHPLIVDRLREWVSGRLTGTESWRSWN